MQSGSSVLSSIFGVLCLAATCLIPLAAIGGGVWFFLNRRKKSQAAVTTPVMPVVPVPVAPVVTNTPAPVAVQQPLAPAPVVPVQPVTAAVPEPKDVSTAAGGLNVSPSELVLLRGDAFSPAAGVLNSIQITGTQAKVDISALAKAVLAAAFLSLREAGNVRFEAGKRKATMGLREVDALYVIPTGAVSAWPEGSYEAKLLAKAQETAGNQHNYVHNVVFQTLRRDDSLPFLMVLTDAQWILAKRGILGEQSEKGFLGISKATLVMPPQTQAALEQADIVPIQSLLSRVQQAEPEIWKMLETEVHSGVRDRTESDNSGPE